MHGFPPDSRTQQAESSTARKPTRNDALSRLLLRHKALMAALVVVSLLLCAQGIDHLANGSKIYAGITVGQVDVSGMTIDQATNAINQTYGTRFAEAKATLFADEAASSNPQVTSEPFEDLSLAESQIMFESGLEDRRQWTVTPSVVGASFDAADLARKAFAVGREDGGIFARISAAGRGRHIDAVCTLDQGALQRLSDSITSAVGSWRQDFAIRMDGTHAEVEDGHDGHVANSDEIGSWLTQALLAPLPEQKIVPFADEPARGSAEQAQRAADSINGAIDGGIELSMGDASVRMDALQLAGMVTSRIEGDGQDARVVATLDANGLAQAIYPEFSQVDKPADFALSFAVDGTDVTVKSNAQGTLPDVAAALPRIEAQLFDGHPRTSPFELKLEQTALPAELPFAQALAAGIVEEVSSYHTSFSSTNAARVNNIRLAAGLIDDSTCPAKGGTWSFNAVVGEATPERGYLGAGTVMDGELQDSIGGGICQVATTVFNAVYESGLPVDRRYNHSIYLPNYPDGRDAAIAYPDMDLVWSNDTNSDVLVKTYCTDDGLSVTLYGQDPDLVVSTKTGEWRPGKEKGTRHVADDTLSVGKEYEAAPGTDGTQITVTRTVRDADGNLVRQDEFESTYQPIDRVVVKGTKQ